MNILHLYRIYDSNFPFLFTLLKINTKKKRKKNYSIFVRIIREIKEYTRLVRIMINEIPLHESFTMDELANSNFPFHFNKP